MAATTFPVRLLSSCCFKKISNTRGSLGKVSSGHFYCQNPGFLQPAIFAGYQYRQKHWNPQFKKERREKFLKVELPDFEAVKKEEKMTPDEMRAKMKEKGIAPPRPWTERPIFISSTGGIFDPYIPPEGDGRVTLISQEGAKQRMEQVSKKGKSYMSLRKIRTFDHEFDIPLFAEIAQKIYIDAHNALTEMNIDKLHELVTEKCYPEMVSNVKKKTIRWKFIQSLEPPHVVHIRCTDVLTKENVFAQLTVRFHTQQTLAVYDRFGRLMHGSEEVTKDVLEYVVFEKHLANQYGMWRIHGKIIPDWLPKRDPVFKTWKQEIKEEEEPVSEKQIENSSKNINEEESPSTKEPPPAMALA